MQWLFFRLAVTRWVLLGTFYTWLSQYDKSKGQDKHQENNARVTNKVVIPNCFLQLDLITTDPTKEAAGTSVTFFHKIEGQVTSPQSQCSF